MFWYEDEVKRLETDKLLLNYKPALIFYGSSSIRLWKRINEDFAQFKPINLGFGGSTLASCVWYFERLMKDVKAKGMVVYAGDNDLGDGRHPEEVYISFKQLVADARKKFGPIPILYISIKPSLQRWNIVEQIKYTNKIIEAETKKLDNVYFIDIFSAMIGENGLPKKELFEWEGLHVNLKGYALWKEIIINFIDQHKISFQ